MRIQHASGSGQPPTAAAEVYLHGAAETWTTFATLLAREPDVVANIEQPEHVLRPLDVFRGTSQP